MVMNISCKSEKSTYNTLASRGVMRKSLHTVMLSGGYNKWDWIYFSVCQPQLTLKLGSKVKKILHYICTVLKLLIGHLTPLV